MDLLGEVRRIGIRLFNGGKLGLDEFGNVSISKMLPDYARLSAGGKLFAMDLHAGTAKAPVVAAPTTSPEWRRWRTARPGKTGPPWAGRSGSGRCWTRCAARAGRWTA